MNRGGDIVTVSNTLASEVIPFLTVTSVYSLSDSEGWSKMKVSFFGSYSVNSQAIFMKFCKKNIYYFKS